MATLINRKMYWQIGDEVLPVTVISEVPNDSGCKRLKVLTENGSSYTARAAQLHPWFAADEVTVKCGGCGDEYVLMVSKPDDRMLRGKACNCQVWPDVESRATKEFYEPKSRHEAAAQYVDADERVAAKGED